MARVCTRCVMDDASDDSIRFDKDGHCNYCNDALSRASSEYFPNERGRAILEATMSRIKAEGKGREFDCIVGVSGGVDSSYVVYLGHQFGLRMLAVHVDDGLDTDAAKWNIRALCEAANVPVIYVRPDLEQYVDLTLALLKASVPNLALAQDNILSATLDSVARDKAAKYVLSGTNFALECILEKGASFANASDGVHLRAIHSRFGTRPIDRLQIMSLTRRYVHGRYLSGVRVVRPLNFVNYNLDSCLAELGQFCGYQYYGGKHHESILTRFLQCHYLPTKYGLDKRKSHFSSMIVSGQMSRDEAIRRLSLPPYPDQSLKEADSNFIAHYLGLSRHDFDALVALPPKHHSDYPRSPINGLAGVARKLRKWLE